MTTRRLGAVALALAVAWALAAAAQEPYPSRPITLVAPFPPGGVADLTARPVAAALERTLKNPVGVLNKTGAAGAVGMQFVATSKPDGYTLLLALSSISIIPEADKIFGRPPAFTVDQFAPIALVSAALGRPAAVVGTTVPINLVAPGQVWGDRVNAFDLRFGKILRFGRTRYNVGIDIINVTNSGAILSYNQSFNPTATLPAQRWLAPTSVLTPRFVKFGAQIDF